MKKIVTAAASIQAEKASIKTHHISAQKLMEGAAQACYESILNHIQSKKLQHPRIVILCGPGNNGGDGFAISSLLQENNFKNDCYFIGDEKKYSSAAAFFLQKVQAQPLSTMSLKLKRMLHDADIIVDAIFGVGLKRPLSGVFAQLVASINKSPAWTLAVDVPSGICSQSGRILGTAVQAHQTLTFEVVKWGLVMPEAWDYVGNLLVKDIGFAASALKKLTTHAHWIQKEDMAPLFQTRSRHFHKGQGGRVLIIAGSQAMPGAGQLSAMAALRAGAGLVTWAFPAGIARQSPPEIILHELASEAGAFSSKTKDFQFLQDFDAVVVGPGLGQNASTAQFLTSLLQKVRVPCVVDADALNLAAHNPQILQLLKGKILTPHPKEMARLCHKKLEDVLQDRYVIAQKFARQYRVHLVLKGYRSIIATPSEEIFVNSSGGPILATAGSGDVLSGVIAAYCAQGLAATQALIAAVYLHGYAGDLLAQKYGDRGAIASEIASTLPQAFGESFA